MGSRRHSRKQRLSRCWMLGSVVGLALALTAPNLALSELRPLVRDMLENLGAVDAIGQGIATEDYQLVERAARDLQSRAEKLRDINLANLDLDPAGDVEFDAFLAKQDAAAAAILQSAKQKDGRSVLRGVQRLFTDACLACHKRFREPANRLHPSVLFMTTLMSAWKDINRGLATNDFTLVGQRAREIEAMVRVLAWDQVIEMTFDVKDPELRDEFRKRLVHMSNQASLIDQAAATENALEVLSALQEMWEGGCLSCHEELR